MWKKYQKSEKAKKNLYLALFALGLIIFLLILGKAAGFLGSFARPFSSGFTSIKNYNWDGKSSINIGFAQIDPVSNKTKDLSIVSYSPKNLKATVLHISNLVYTDLPKNYGSWRVESIYKLGEEENPKIGGELLKMSLSKLVGLPLDGIIISQKNDGKFEDKISSWRKNPISLSSFLSDIKTDLTPFEMARLILSLRGVREDRLISLDFATSSITESKLLPDSSRVLGVDNIRLDSFIRQNLSDESIIDENLTVAIFNATNRGGLAAEVSRVVTNLGANVVIMATAQNLQSESLVLVKPEDDALLDTVTYQRLAQVFAPHCLKNTCQSTDPKILSSRAQINIVLGEDYWNLWYDKN